MVIVPNSKVQILQCPLKLDDNNQITFTDITAQYNYFNSLNKLVYTNLTYIRKDNVLRIPTHKEANDNLPTFEDLLNFNYVMYQNTAYNNKWFYAFITDITYQNDGMTELTIETDAFQSWQFSIIYKPSFIEREHVSDDTKGLHTIPENLEHGPYICSYYDEITNFKIETSKIIVGTTWLPSNTTGIPTAQIYGGVFAGVYYVAFDYTGGYAKAFIQALDGLGRGDAVVTVFMCPNSLLGELVSFSGDLESKENLWNGSTQNKTYHIEGYFVGNDYGGKTVIQTLNIAENTTLGGYTPKNNKCFCYPFNYLMVTNNCGSNATYRWEDFINNTAVLSVKGTVGPGCSVKLYPSNYKKIADSISNLPGYNDGIVGAKIPVCSWQNDSFTNWMTQQSVNVMMNQAQTLIGGTATVVSGGMVGGVGNLFSQQANYLSERYQHALVPPQASGSINSADVSWALGEGNLAYYKMTIKPEYAQIIDDHFSQFGYQVNRLAIPNFRKRSNWDYMKTTSINLEGNIPENDMLKIKALFDNGCTFWHTTANYLDYSQTNSII